MKKVKSKNGQSESVLKEKFLWLVRFVKDVAFLKILKGITQIIFQAIVLFCAKSVTEKQIRKMGQGQKRKQKLVWFAQKFLFRIIPKNTKLAVSFV